MNAPAWASPDNWVAAMDSSTPTTINVLAAHPRKRPRRLFLTGSDSSSPANNPATGSRAVRRSDHHSVRTQINTPANIPITRLNGDTCMVMIGLEIAPTHQVVRPHTINHAYPTPMAIPINAPTTQTINISLSQMLMIVDC